MHTVTIEWSGDSQRQAEVVTIAEELGAEVAGNRFTFTARDLGGLREVVDAFLESCSIIERDQDPE